MIHRFETALCLLALGFLSLLCFAGFYYGTGGDLLQALLWFWSVGLILVLAVLAQVAPLLERLCWKVAVRDLILSTQRRSN